VPWICLIPPISQLVWFNFAKQGGPAVFFLFVPAFHSLQYLFIAWITELAERQTPGARGGLWVSLVSARWFGVNVLGGALLFYSLPKWVGAWVGGPGASGGLVAGVVLAAVQIHHFIVDGVIWKLQSMGAKTPLTIQGHQFLSPEYS